MQPSELSPDLPHAALGRPAPAGRWYTHWPEDYRAAIWHEIRTRRCRRIMEIGGTTHRSTGTDDMPDHVESFTIGDISPDELRNVPRDKFEILEFDASGDVSGIEDRFDLIFSKFCGEHMEDGKRFHRNMYELLAPGGAAIHMISTLFASPFVINHLIPETLSRSIVRIFQPERFNNTLGKFPAFYSLCRGSQDYMQAALAGIGFSSVEVRQFYGHRYYDRIPGLRGLETAFSKLCMRRGWSFYTSYAIVITRK